MADTSSRPAATPLAAFVAVVVVAVILRFWNLGDAGIASEEAGRCTLAALSTEPAGPRPLLAWIFRGLFSLWAPVDTVAIGAVAILGVATVAVLFLAGRRWVGDSAALIGAAALAAMPLHVRFSRTAESGVPFAFTLLVTAWASSAAIARRSAWFAGVALLAAVATAWLARDTFRTLGFYTPLLPALALAAGAGLDALARWAAPRWVRGRAAVLSAFLLVPGVWSSLPALALESRSYELAGRFLAQGPSDARPDVLATQSALLFYLSVIGEGHAYLDVDDPRAREALAGGAFRYFVEDQRVPRTPLAVDRSAWTSVAVIGNPAGEIATILISRSSRRVPRRASLSSARRCVDSSPSSRPSSSPGVPSNATRSASSATRSRAAARRSRRTTTPSSSARRSRSA